MTSNLLAIAFASGPALYNVIIRSELIFFLSPWYTPFSLVRWIPSNYLSLRRLVYNFSNIPNISKKHFHAADLLDIGCSIAVNIISLSDKSFTNYLRPRLFLQTLSTLLNVNSSPPLTKSKYFFNLILVSVYVPLWDSANILSYSCLFKIWIWVSRPVSWLPSILLTLA